MQRRPNLERFGRSFRGGRHVLAGAVLALMTAGALADDIAAKAERIMAMTLLDPAGHAVADAASLKPEAPAHYERWSKPLLLILVLTDDAAEGSAPATTVSQIMTAAQGVGIGLQSCVVRLDQPDAGTECLEKSPDILLGTITDAKHVPVLWERAKAVKFADAAIRTKVLTRLRDMLVDLKTGRTCQSSNLSTGAALSATVLVNHVFDPVERATCATVLAYRAMGVAVAAPRESIAALGERLAAAAPGDVRPDEALKYLYSEGLRPEMTVQEYRSELAAWLGGQP
jgi:hypothetical protein